MKNGKAKGEIGERIAIGELAKFGIDIILPMSDNLPFDFLIFYSNKFYKCQVKSSFQKSKSSEGAVYFSLVSSNWYSKTEHLYTEDEIDLFILCDGNNIYLFKYQDLKNKRSVTIRITNSKNNQSKNIIKSENVILSEKRLKEILWS